MSQDTIIFFLAAVIAVLSFVVLYQRFVFRKGIQKKIGDMGDTLEQILDEKSDEKVMVFTDDKALIHLSSQINRLLDDRQRIQADFRRSEISAKNMLSNISHDIRTPMTVILGYLEIMRLEAEGKDKMVAKVEQKARKVMELINQFFTLAKLESGDTQVEMGRVNLSECCRENVLDFYELLTQKEFQVEIEIPEESVFVEGNEEALQRILFNLISNAVRYGSDGKYLGIAVRTEGAFALIHVTDRGKGIEKAFAGTVFERLFTMEDSRNREIQGNGLGLTIARNLAVKMGGDITLVSEPDVSTTFTVKLRKMTF
ncbi:sensor histidine kinase [Blautia sp.]|uniref:sensor histidine kinase n=1 Tax=Blautia sp. TaxID=1955243 RepID=UPI0026715F16|nr:sensor histidine kinase [uncultured Blautia sp.]